LGQLRDKPVSARAVNRSKPCDEQIDGQIHANQAELLATEDDGRYAAHHAGGKRRQWLTFSRLRRESLGGAVLVYLPRNFAMT
jgi:hypothetical protein